MGIQRYERVLFTLVIIKFKLLTIQKVIKKNFFFNWLLKNVLNYNL